MLLPAVDFGHSWSATVRPQLYTIVGSTRVKIDDLDKVPGLTNRAHLKVEDFIQLVSRHPSSNPIKSQRIEEKLGLTGQEVRAIHSQLHVIACRVVIGSDNRGYYLCKTPAELQANAEHIGARITRLTRVHQGINRQMAWLSDPTPQRSLF